MVFSWACKVFIILIDTCWWNVQYSMLTQNTRLGNIPIYDLGDLLKTTFRQKERKKNQHKGKEFLSIIWGAPCTAGFLFIWNSPPRWNEWKTISEWMTSWRMKWPPPPFRDWFSFIEATSMNGGGGHSCYSWWMQMSVPVGSINPLHTGRIRRQGCGGFIGRRIYMEPTAPFLTKLRFY